jgi:hypothetical protein
VATPCDSESIGLGIGVRPGENRRHVFDCEDGIRLIVSRDDTGDAEVGVALHLSGSIRPDSDAWHDIRRAATGRGAREAAVEFARRVVARWRDVSGDAGPLEFLGFSGGKGVPHWFRKQA